MASWRAEAPSSKSAIRPNHAAPIVSFRSPTSSRSSNGSTPIVATVSDTNLDYLSLEIAPLGFGYVFDKAAPGNAARGCRGAVTVLDPGAPHHGFSRLRLITAVDLSWPSTSDEALIEINTAAKVRRPRSAADRSVAESGG